jgi:hypothetical protein
MRDEPAPRRGSFNALPLRSRAIIAIFGVAPVQFELVDVSKPGWRRV